MVKLQIRPAQKRKDHRWNATESPERMAVPSHESRVTSHGAPSHESRVTNYPLQTTLIVAAVLLAAPATLAPDITLWDAGEFNAAIGRSASRIHRVRRCTYSSRNRATAFGFLHRPSRSTCLSGCYGIACAFGRAITRWTQKSRGGIASGSAAARCSPSGRTPP
jgi:hypothetical protein